MPDLSQHSDAADIKDALLGGTASFREIARALSCSERTIYRLNLPYILVAGKRRAVLALARKKIMARMQGGDPPPPRGPGRPRIKRLLRADAEAAAKPHRSRAAT